FARVASEAAASTLGTPAFFSPSRGNWSYRLNSGRVLDSKVLHLDHAAHAAGSAVHLWHGHDGGNGSEVRRWPCRRGRRSARAQEFGCAVYRHLEEPNFSRSPHPAV